ncbi:pyridoxal phosphate-dependent transferase [Pisolithus thermaeus]|nr:pyridoxal phosphate-dependent transferase [Pisolithus thermaeus]
MLRFSSLLNAFFFACFALAFEWARVSGATLTGTRRVIVHALQTTIENIGTITIPDVIATVCTTTIPGVTTAITAVVERSIASPVDTLKSLLLYYVLCTYGLKVYRHVRARGLRRCVYENVKAAAKYILLLFFALPPGRSKVQSELSEVRRDIEKKLIPDGVGVERHLELPRQGLSLERILMEMEKMDEEMGSNNPGDDEHRAKGVDWRDGKISGAVYHGGLELTRVIVAALERYALANPLHPGVFPAIRKMEAEIVSICLRLFHNPGGAGTMTSGGTESIVMAIKTYRDWARTVKGITEPEMVVPLTAHAAFDKGAAYMGVKVHTIPVDPVTRKVDMKRVRRAINPNTIMLVGSAINFPDGNQDDIVALGQLASWHDIGLHVDCCLGSFVLPFLETSGLADGEIDAEGKVRYRLEPFDFRVKGVTSISCDTHKYGFAPKGSSVIMYHDASLRRYQYYVNPSWTGGVYASPSLSGSRPGSLIAGTWAALHYIGSDGYLASCKSIVTCARQIANAITASIPSLYVLGSPPSSVVAFASRDKAVDIYEVGDAMAKRGWHLNAITEPRGLHIACTKLTLAVVDTFVEDLKACVEQARLAPEGKGTMVALYGLGSSSPVGPTLVGEVATIFLDTLYQA